MWAALDWPILTAKEPEKSGSFIVEVQSGQSLWDSFGEPALTRGRTECETCCLHQLLQSPLL